MPAKKGLNIDTAATEKLPTTVDPAQYLQSLEEAAAALLPPVAQPLVQPPAPESTVETANEPDGDEPDGDEDEDGEDEQTVVHSKNMVKPRVEDQGVTVQKGQIAGRICKTGLLYIRVIGSKTTYKLDMSLPDSKAARDKVMEHAVTNDKQLEMYAMVEVVINNPKHGQIRPDGRPYSEYLKVPAAIASSVKGSSLNGKNPKVVLAVRETLVQNNDGTRRQVRYTVIGIAK